MSETSRHATVEICTGLFITYSMNPAGPDNITVHLLTSSTPPVPSSTCEWIPVLATAGTGLDRTAIRVEQGPLKEFDLLSSMYFVPYLPYPGTIVDCTLTRNELRMIEIFEFRPHTTRIIWIPMGVMWTRSVNTTR